MRLDKYISACTGMSRSEIKKTLKKQPASVNGAAVRTPEFKVDETDDSLEIFFLGKRLIYQKYLYIFMNKPAGYVCSNREGNSPTVFSLLREGSVVAGTDDQEKRKKEESDEWKGDGSVVSQPVIPGLSGRDLFTVGRLDKDTTGLLLITDDGDFSHRMLSPRHHVDKTYFLTTDRPIPADAPRKCKSGLDIGDDKLTAPAILKIAEDQRSAFLTIHEGRFHQVKRMMHAVGCEVETLQRISMGPFELDSALPEGGYRFFSTEELTAVKGINGSPYWTGYLKR